MPTMVGPGNGTEGQVSMSQIIAQAPPINVTLGSTQTVLENYVFVATLTITTTTITTMVRSNVPLTVWRGRLPCKQLQDWHFQLLMG
jgi:hypothetical protein